MPYARNGDAELYYEVDGEGGGERDVDAVAFYGELGLGPWQWGWQHAALAGPYRAVVPAARGTGDSSAPPGPYSIAELARDLEAVLADAGVAAAHVVGVGLGGLVALRAALGSGRVRKLVLVGTPAAGDGLDPDPLWADPGDPEALEAATAAALSRGFVRDHPDAVSRIVEWRAAEDADRTAWEATRAALAGADLRGRLHEVTNEALVVHGREDALCPAVRGEELAEGLPRGEFHGVEAAGHLVNVEASRVVNDRVLGFLDG